MKKIVILLVLFFVFSGAEAKNREKRHFSEFHSVYFFGNIHVELVKSDSNYAILSSNEVLDLGSVTTELKKGRLFIRNTGIGDAKTLKLILYYKYLDEIIAKAGVELESKEVFNAEDFNLRLSKGAEAHIKVKNKRLKAIVIQGSGLHISGYAHNVEVSTNTGGIFHGFNLKVKEAKLRSVAGGKIDILMDGKMEASANTGGMIYYKGEAKIVSQKVSTGGIIEKQK